MTNLSLLDGVVQANRGVQANMDGQPFNVYRVGAASNLALLSGTPTIAGFQAKLEKASKGLVENDSLELLAFKADCDNRALVKGDLLVTIGYETDGGVFYYAQSRPTEPTIFVRAELQAVIVRPTTSLSSVAGTPGNRIQPGWGGVYAANNEVFTLTAGIYAIAAAGATAAKIQVGVQPRSRIENSAQHGPAADMVLPYSEDQYVVYVPPLPGASGEIALQQHDVIQDVGGVNRYAAVKLYSSDPTGFVGTVIVARKLPPLPVS